MEKSLEIHARQEFTIHPATRVGKVSLTVSDLENLVAFYQPQALGFQLHWREGDEAGLGSGGADFLRLVQVPGAKRYTRVTGLYHYGALSRPARAGTRGQAPVRPANSQPIRPTIY